MAKQKADKSWKVITGPAVETLNRLVDTHHGNLKDCAILLVGKPKCGTRAGRIAFAVSTKAPELLRAALRQHGEEADYVIAVGLDLWKQMPERLQERVLDKALCYFGGKDPEKDDALTMRFPDVSGEFAEVIQRHGLPENDPELQAFVKVAARQMKIDFKQPDEPK